MVVVVVLDRDGVLQPVAQLPDAGFEQALLVLRRVVLEVLGKVAERARGRDRLDGGRPARALQLRQLQTMVEISAERNSTIIFPIPMELLEAIRSITDR